MDLLDRLPCAVLVTDGSGRVLTLNAELAAMVGGTVQDRLNMPMEGLFPPAGRIFLQTHVWPMLLRDGRVSEVHLQVTGAQQQRIPVLLNCMRCDGRQGVTYYWTLFVAQDRHRFETELVSARNRAEDLAKERAEAQRFIKTITDSLPGLVAYWDKDLRCHFANARYLEWFGKRPEDLVGNSLLDVLGEQVFALNEPYVRAALAGEEQQFERALVKADGSVGHTWAHYIPDVIDGEVRGFFVNVSDVTHLKSVEAALRSEMGERERVHALLHDSTRALQEAQRLGQIGSWHWAAEGDVLWWSPMAFEVLGRDPTLPPPKFGDVATIYGAGIVMRLRKASARARRSGTAFAFEFEHVASDGRRRWVEARGEVARGPDGAFAGLRGTVQDISRHKAQERAVVLAQDRLRAMYEATPAMLHSIDAQGKLVHVSDAWLARMGYRRGEVVGRASSDFLTPASREHAVKTVLPEFFRTGRCNDVSYQMVTHSGEVIDVLLSAIIEGDDTGAVRSLAVLQDVTLRRRAERALDHEHQRLRNLIEGTAAGTWEWNVQTGEVIVNQRWAAIIGWNASELGAVTNQLRADIAHPDELPNTRQLLREHFAGEREVYVSEVRLRHRDGHWVWVEDRGRLISRTPDGRPEWVFGIHVDISERKLNEEALRRSEKLLNRTGEVAGVGGWEFDLRSAALMWSKQVRRIHGVPDDYVPTLEQAVEFYAPEARTVIQTAVETAIAEGKGWDLEVALIRADGRRIHVRSVGQAEFENGEPTRLLGAFQDITENVAQRSALRASHQRMALAADSGGIGVWDLDLTTQTLTVDAWMVRLYNLAPGEETNANALWSQRVHPQDRDAVALAVDLAIARQRTLEAGYRIVWDDGSVHHVKVSARVTRDDHGRALSMVGVSWDVTALCELSAELSKQHELLRVTLQSIGDAVITTDAVGQVTWLNPVAERMTGWLSSEAQGRPLIDVFQIVDESTREPVGNPVSACLNPDRSVGPVDRALLISRDGAEYGVEDSAAPIRNPHGDVLGVVLVFRDVSEQRRLSGEMTYRATHDALTGLVNRVEFESRLLRALRNAHDDEGHHALLYIDLDHFKQVNDACGHAAGDQLLQQMSKLLGDAIRTRDTLARLGGDEFAIILEHCNIDQAHRLAQKICDRMEAFRFIHDGRRFRIGTSIGLVPVDKRWASTSAIKQAADTACYAAKEEGRNRVHAWFDSDAAMRVRQVEMHWTARIEQALDDDGFVLFAQRIQPLRGGQQGLHAEVLLRMKNDDGSFALPGAFLPAAERFHLVTRIDRWVLQRAVAWMTESARLEETALLSVNLSGQSIGDRGFHAWALELLQRAGATIRSRLCLEITETAAVTNLADAAVFVHEVRGLGVKVALDDFGAGASSFGYLKSLSVDYLKIDGQFVRDLLTDPLDAAAVRCFVDVARVVGVKTVAEFVEDPAVLARLREIGVDCAQGYLIHRPEPIEQLVGESATVVT